MSVNEISPNAQIFLRDLFGKLDANGDGQVSTAEFGSVLDTLLQQLTNLRQTQGLGSASGAVSASAAPIQQDPVVATPAAAAAAVISGPMGPLAGFDMHKLNDPTVTSDKYKLGRALEGLDPTAENLQKVATGLGFKSMGSDMLQLPDGTKVDAIYDVGGSQAHWQFLVPDKQ